jgi:hypothetical protein
VISTFPHLISSPTTPTPNPTSTIPILSKQASTPAAAAAPTGAAPSGGHHGHHLHHLHHAAFSGRRHRHH